MHFSKTASERITLSHGCAIDEDFDYQRLAVVLCGANFNLGGSSSTLDGCDLGLWGVYVGDADLVRLPAPPNRNVVPASDATVQQCKKGQWTPHAQCSHEANPVTQLATGNREDALYHAPSMLRTDMLFVRWVQRKPTNVAFATKCEHITAHVQRGS